MEVMTETPPPLPPKTKKALSLQELPTDSQPSAAAYVNGTTIEVGSLKVVNNRRRDEDGFARPHFSQVSVKRVTAPQSDESIGGEKLTQVAAVGEAECENVSVKEPRKIITWRTHRKPDHFPESEDLYENVSNEDVNWLEPHVKSSVGRGDEVAGVSTKGAKRKIPKIEVRQEEHKTVVKISIKDTASPEEEMSERSCFQVDRGGSNGFAVYANCDRGDAEEEGIYENVRVLVEKADEGCYENLSMGCHENGDVCERVYANVSEGIGSHNRGLKKELRTEANYCSGEAPKSDEVCNDHEFQISSNNVTIGKVSPPPAKSVAKREGDESYENDKSDYRIYANENLCRNGEKPDETAEKYESEKPNKKASVIEVFLQRPAATSAKVDKPETEYADDNSSADPFDSGTCSDVDTLPSFLHGKKANVIVTIKSLGDEKNDYKKLELGHRRAESLTSSGVGVDSEESDDEKSNISCDSLNSNDPEPQSYSEDHGYHTPNSEDKTGSPIDQIEYENVIHDKTDIIQQVANVSRRIKTLRMENSGVYTAKPLEPSDFEEYENVYVFDPPKTYKKKPPPPPPPAKPVDKSSENDSKKTLPKNLLRDIRSRNVRLSATYPSGEKQEGNRNSVADAVSNLEARARSNDSKHPVVEERTYEERKNEVKVSKICAMEVDTDKFYKFHLAENVRDKGSEGTGHEDETFAGVKDYLCREKPAAITSAKGTIRGVKNRVKAGIATFLQLHENKSYKDRDAGKVVVYTTTMGIVRETYHKCIKVKQILRTLMVKFEERDVFMSSEAQEEIRDRMKCNAILVPQVFVEGQHIGDAETIERLNEMGELRTILKPYKSVDACSTCKVCGGYRLLPCSVCKGSKKSIHRNHFTAEFVALKCMNCDQVGLTKCYAC